MYIYKVKAVFNYFAAIDDLVVHDIVVVVLQQGPQVVAGAAAARCRAPAATPGLATWLLPGKQNLKSMYLTSFKQHAFSPPSNQPEG